MNQLLRHHWHRGFLPYETLCLTIDDYISKLSHIRFPVRPKSLQKLQIGYQDGTLLSEVVTIVFICEMLDFVDGRVLELTVFFNVSIYIKGEFLKVW